MRSTTAILVMALGVASTGVAEAGPAGAPPPAGCETCGDPPRGEYTRGVAHDSFMLYGGIATGTLAAVQGIEYIRTGEQNTKVSGLGMIVTLPILVYGIHFINKDSSDVGAWALTVGASALFVHGLVPLVRIYMLDDASYNLPPVQQKPQMFEPRRHVQVRAAPTVLVGADAKPTAGLLVSGLF